MPTNFCTLYRRTLCLVAMSLCCLAGIAQLPLLQQFPEPQREVRGVWLTTLMGLDWPRTTDAQRQRETLCRMLDELQRTGINTVFFQSRIRATTAYPSAIEPWDGIFTGTAGKAPTYDPLAFAVEECHRRGMEIHAWVVCYPVCKVPVARQLGKRSIVSRHPAMVQRCGDQWMMDPGVPGVAEYIADICREIVTNYDVDGINLDYVRYPESGIPFSDSKTYRKYGNGKPLAEWRRDNVTRTVRAIHDAVRAVRPWVKLSCSPVGKYASLPRHASPGWNARDAVYQDAMLWLERGWMDMLLPMLYFDGNNYYPFVHDWQDRAEAVADGRPIVPGLGVYFLAPTEKNWPLTTVTRQMAVARQLGMGGAAFFRAKFLLDDVKDLQTWLRTEFYTTPVLPPAMTWLDKTLPPAPRYDVRRVSPLTGVPSILAGETALDITWEPVTHDTPVTYNVYRVENGCRRLIAHHLRGTSFRHVPALPRLLDAQYIVVAMDAYGNESR